MLQEADGLARRVLRQAWELDDAAKAERLLRNLAQRLERDWSGVCLLYTSDAADE